MHSEHLPLTCVDRAAQTNHRAKTTTTIHSCKHTAVDLTWQVPFFAPDGAQEMLPHELELEHGQSRPEQLPLGTLLGGVLLTMHVPGLPPLQELPLSQAGTPASDGQHGSPGEPQGTQTRG